MPHEVGIFMYRITHDDVGIGPQGPRSIPDPSQLGPAVIASMAPGDVDDNLRTLHQTGQIGMFQIAPIGAYHQVRRDSMNVEPLGHFGILLVEEDPAAIRIIYYAPVAIRSLISLSVTYTEYGINIICVRLPADLRNRSIELDLRRQTRTGITAAIKVESSSPREWELKVNGSPARLAREGYYRALI
jgi:hypothetical protein